MRILGIDYGTKRVGIAVSDPSMKFALPFTVLQNSGEVAGEIEKIAKENEVKTIILGESRDYKGQPNKIMDAVNKLKTNLETCGFEVIFEPEFMTSVQAERFQGKNEKTDSSAAALILQSYLDREP